jgi:O-antigen/teichoic acid export membrane protein
MSLRSIGSNWLLTALAIVVAYVLMPYTLQSLGEAQYGTWLLITSVTSQLGLLVLGLPMATIRLLAERTVGNRDELNDAVGSCAWIYVIISALALPVGLVLFLVFRALYNEPIPDRFGPQVPIAFALVIVQTAVGLLGQLPFGIMAAHDDFRTRNRVLIMSTLLRFVLTLALLRSFPSIIALGVVLVCCMATEIILGIFLLRRRYPYIRLRPKHFTWSTAKRLLTFSVYVLVATVGSQLIFQTDALVIGKVLDVRLVPYFASASSFSIYLLGFVIAAETVIVPETTKLVTAGRMRELHENFYMWSKLCVSLTLLVVIYLVVSGPRFLGWWMAGQFERPSGAVLRILMLSNMIFLPVRAVSLPILMGIGKPKAPAFGFLITGIANVILSVFLGRQYGLDGIAAGTALPNVAFAIFLLVFTCRQIGASMRTFVRYVVPRPFLGAIPAFLVLVWFHRVVDVRTFWQLFTAGLLMLVTYAATSVVFVFANDDRLDLLALLKQKLRVGVASDGDDGGSVDGAPEPVPVVTLPIARPTPARASIQISRASAEIEAGESRL